MAKLTKEGWDAWHHWGQEAAKHGGDALLPPDKCAAYHGGDSEAFIEALEAWNAGVADYNIRTANGKPVDQPNLGLAVYGVPEREQNDPNADIRAALTPNGNVDTAPIVTENPKDAVGSSKVAFSCIPAVVVAELGVAMAEGARKYGRHNYRAAKIRASIYFDAVLRHMTAWFEGEDIDPDSGMSHVTKAIASLAVLRDGQINGNLIDDRPPPAKEGWMADLNIRTAALVEKYPNPKDAVTRKENS